MSYFPSLTLRLGHFAKQLPSRPQSTATGDSTSQSTSAEDAHRNEGFLKSIWHNLTNHPAHQKPPEEGSDAKEKGSTPDAAKKKEDEPKKASGSGSG